MRRSIALFALLLLADANAASAQTAQPAQPAKPAVPGWTSDPKTGCKVWNLDPHPNETISWSGACKNGVAEGTGVVQWFWDGKPVDRYQGGYHAGLENGNGVYVWANGDRYEGGYLDNRRSGRGSYAWASGMRYDGEWLAGKAHGQGRAVDPKGQVYEGTWVNGCFRQGGRTANVGATRAECGF
jgi:hypothetical protein